MKSPFIHLHTHSHYSLLDGLSKVPEMVALAKEYDMPALALTDHGNMYGAIEFYKTCKKEGIKPIVGVEAYITPGSRHDKRPGVDTTRYHLTLLAKNTQGYKNLIKLVTYSHLEGYYYKPRMDKELLRKYSEGLICLSGCFGSELSKTLRKEGDDKIERAEKVIREYQDIFGKENYFLEIMYHPGVENIEDVKKDIISLSKKLDIPLVGTQDSHYLHPEDARAHETLLAIQTNADLNDENRFSMESDDFSFINTEKAYEYFKDTPEAVENTKKIADMCEEVELDLGHWVWPDLKIPEGSTYDEELKKASYEGIEKRGLEKTPELTERIEYELNIIKDKGYASYILIVADLIRFARENGILANTRGSAAGSMVSYLNGITNVDPIKFRLPFERFLNPERPSLADIDMDFADTRRDEVIEYTKKKYGEDKVAQIGTFGTMLARGSVRDVARALGHSYETGDKISRMIPLGAQGFPMTIDRAMDEVPELKQLYESDATTKEIIDLAKRLEGCVRHISVHAAGVVISPIPLVDIVPTQFDPRGGKIITQYDMYTGNMEGVANLPKFDFLGIKNLTILENAVRLVKHHQSQDIDIENIPLNDKNTFEALARGETMGLFQLGGSGMTRYLKELKPTRIDDINAMIALYRPGPLAFIPEYIKRKQNPSLVSYPDSRLKEILEPTFGILIYQDDVLLVAVNIAGYSWGEADKFRKAVGKKIPKEMAAQKEKFINGCIANNTRKDVAHKLWDMIETFAAYGFNKAHAASYGWVAYQTAYMKANFPLEYMAAVLTADSGNAEKIAEIIGECKRMNIPVLPPDINESFADFTVVRKGKKEEIRFGLYTIKNLGKDISDAVISEREEGGKFKSFTDFLERIRHRNLNKKSLEALVMCGAFDTLEERGILFENIENALAYNRSHADETAQQSTLFGLMENKDSMPGFSLKEASPATKEQKLAWEKELLGLYISGHPLDKFRKKIEEKNFNIKKVKTGFREGMLTVIAGVIEEPRIVSTRKGARMAFIKVADLEDSIEVVVFPNTFNKFRSFLDSDACIAIKGRISDRNGERSIIAEAIKELGD